RVFHLAFVARLRLLHRGAHLTQFLLRGGQGLLGGFDLRVGAVEVLHGALGDHDLSPERGGTAGGKTDDGKGTREHEASRGENAAGGEAPVGEGEVIAPAPELFWFSRISRPRWCRAALAGSADPRRVTCGCTSSWPCCW